MQAIHQCCSVSLLKAHRLAQGWTAARTIEEIKELCQREDLDPPKANVDLLNSWENGRSRPRPETIDHLSRLYRSNGIRLGFVADYGDDTGKDESISIPRRPSEPPEAGQGKIADSSTSTVYSGATGSAVGAARRPMTLYRFLGSGESRTAELLAETECLRREVDRALTLGSVSEMQLDVLDEEVLRYRREYLVTPPATMLCRLMLEFTGVRHLLAERQPGPIQRRLSHTAAVLAVLSADALMKLGDLRQSRAWYGTAKIAADDTGDPRLRALVRAQAAMLPYYYGDPREAVRLSVEAQALARSSPSSPAALAAAAEGRARARVGDHSGAEAALARARDTFTRLSTPNEKPLAFDFTEERLYLYLSGAHAFLPNSARAESVHEHALALGRRSAGPSIDPVLVGLDRATFLAAHGDESGACAIAEQSLLSLPSEHRTSILFVRARDVRRALDPARQTRALRSLDEALRLDTGVA